MLIIGEKELLIILPNKNEQRLSFSLLEQKRNKRGGGGLLFPPMTRPDAIFHFPSLKSPKNERKKINVVANVLSKKHRCGALNCVVSQWGRIQFKRSSSRLLLENRKKKKKKWEKGIKGRAPSFLSKCFGWEEEQVVDNAIELISANLHQTALIELEWLSRGWSPATALP